MGSQADGRFPTNVILMRVNYDLEIAKSGYETLKRTKRSISRDWEQ